MKKKTVVLIIGVLLMTLIFIGVAFGQEIPVFARDINTISGIDHVDEENEFSLICSGEMTHPVLTRLAEVYEVDYADLLVYFCEYEFGIGEIRHALFTAQYIDLDSTYQDILDWRYAEGMKDVGWGEIWQELGLIGRNRQNREHDEGYEAMHNKPVLPPGMGGPHPGKGHGLKK